MTMSAALDATRRTDWRHRKQTQDAAGGLARLLRRGDDVTMLERRYGYFPQAFVRRGRRYDVYRVERCWMIVRRGLRGKVERCCFRVRARSRADGSEDDRTLDVCQDLRTGRWHSRAGAG